jgi:hypothetical protein
MVCVHETDSVHVVSVRDYKSHPYTRIGEIAMGTHPNHLVTITSSPVLV